MIMVVEIRMYKQYDLDLLSLFDAGYPVATLYRNIISNFANGRPIKFIIDEPIQCSLKDKHTVRTRIFIEDKQAIKMLKGIKRRYRNAFCKMLLRNSLVQQNMDCFFAKSDFFVTTAINLEKIKSEEYIEIPLSSLKNKRKIVIPDTFSKKQSSIKIETIIEKPKESKELLSQVKPKFLEENDITEDVAEETKVQSFSDDEDDDLYDMFSKL